MYLSKKLDVEEFSRIKRNGKYLSGFDFTTKTVMVWNLENDDSLVLGKKLKDKSLMTIECSSKVRVYKLLVNDCA